MNLKVGTYNIQHGRWHAHFCKTGEEIIDLDGVAEVIRAMGFDICGLNEVRRNDGALHDVDQAKLIAEKLGYHFVFAKAITHHKGYEYGNALVSKYPIRSYRAIPIAVPVEKRLSGQSRYEDRVLLIAEIEVQGRVLTMMICHFGLCPDEIQLAVDTVKAEVAKLTGHAIFTGDLNLVPTSTYYAELASVLKDSTVNPALPLTFPSHAPNKKIDYLFASADVRITDVAAPAVTQTDHCPYIATVAW
ncbi:MAG: hypothetical protein E7668_03425 [Ruminococcaceae bacterium]|nr:hypothetical protein [Oscillospiraceae bacterium]